MEHADKATYLVALHQNGGGRAVQGSEAGCQFVFSAFSFSQQGAGANGPVKVAAHEQLFRLAESSYSSVLGRSAEGQELVDENVRSHGLAVVADRYLRVLALPLDGDVDAVGVAVHAILRNLTYPTPPPVGVVGLGFCEELSANLEACHRSGPASVSLPSSY